MSESNVVIEDMYNETRAYDKGRQAGAAAMQEACAQAACPYCDAGVPVSRCHDPKDLESQIFTHVVAEIDDHKLAERCDAQAIRALKPEELLK